MSDKLSAGSVQGYDRIMQCAHERHKKKDIDNRDSIDRIISSVHGNVCWHSNCYSSFTSKTHIDRLKMIHTEPCTSQNTSIETKKLRSTEKHIHWDKCMFCQERCNEQLHSVQSFNTSKKIIDATRYDHKLSLAFAGICDLIASEGHVLELEEVWKYYKLLCTKTDETVPKSFISRRATFKDKVESLVKNVYGFHTLSKSEDREKGIVLLPIEFSHIPIQ